MHNEKLVKKLAEHEAKFKTPDIIAKYLPVKKIKKTDIIEGILKQKRIIKFDEKVRKSSKKLFSTNNKFVEEEKEKILANRKRRLEKYGRA